MASRYHIFTIFSLILVLLMATSVSAITTFTAEETEFLSLSVDTIDLDGDVITYTFSEPFDENGEWLTDYDSAGEYTVTITASDGIETVTKYVQVIVEETNREPYLIEDSLIFSEEDEISLGDYLFDPDSDVLIYSFSEPFNDDGTWTPTPVDAGRYVVEVEVSDAEFTISRWVEVVIEETNQAPEFVDSFSDDFEITISEGDILDFYIQTFDLDDDELTTVWNFANQGDAVGTSGSLEFNYFTEGEYDFSVTVSDAEFQITKNWVIVVENTNRAPEFTESMYNFDAKEGQQIELDPSNYDQDGDTLTYSVEEPFDSEGIWDIGYDSAGVHNVILTANDGEFDSSVLITVNVEDIDLAPIFSYDLETSNLAEGDELSVLITVSDPDGDDLTVDAINIPEDALFEEIESGEYSLTWEIPMDTIVREQNILTNILNALRLEQTLLREQTVSLQIEACGKEFCHVETIDVTVQNTNQAPEFIEAYDQFVTETDLVEPYFLATDADGDIVKYYHGEPLNEEGQWQTGFEDEGEYYVTITASDGYLTTSETILVDVEKFNREPTVWTDDYSFTILEGETLEFYIEANDEDIEDELTLTLTNGPQEASLSQQTFSWTPDFDTVVAEEWGIWTKVISGSERLTKMFASDETVQWIEITVTDGIVEIPMSVEVIVKNVNQAPVVVAASPSEVQNKIDAGVELDFAIELADYDNDELDYKWSFSGFDYETITGTDQISRIFTSDGEKRVNVEVSDGLESVEYSWIIDVHGSSDYGRSGSSTSVSSSSSSSSSSSGSGSNGDEPSYAVYTVEDWK